VAISDVATDSLGVLFNSDAGRAYLAGRRHVIAEVLDALPSLGLSSLCNILAAIKVAKYYQYGPEDAVVTVATDGADLYASERDLAMRKYFAGGFDQVAAAETFGRHMLGAAVDHTLELSFVDRHRLFNLGYYTWVEQQGVSVQEFNARRQPSFWSDLRKIMPEWDARIREFNALTGVAAV
jgi:cysteine synthase